MKTLLGTSAALACCALFAAPAHSASFSSCGSVVVDGTGKVRYAVKGDVTCAKAKSLLKGAGLGLCFDNSLPGGWKKVARPVAGGDTKLNLVKGSRVVKTNAC